MYPQGRDRDDVFDLDEVFYHRVHPSRIQSDGKVDPAHVRCPDLSSNRSKYSKPFFVLYPRATVGNYAVFRFGLQEVPPQIMSPNPGGKPTVYDVRTVHDPINDPGQENYGHCETRVFRNEERMTSGKVSRGAVKFFQAEMSKVLELERESGLPFP